MALWRMMVYTKGFKEDVFCTTRLIKMISIDVCSLRGVREKNELMKNVKI